MTVYKVLNEYIVEVEEFGTKLKGRVVQEISDGIGVRFQWDVSHYYRPSDGTQVYMPSNSAMTFNDAERHLLAYLQDFSNLDVTPNDMF